jgi:hypothetical protein
MSRSYDPANVITLPVLSTRSAHALAQSLLSAGDKPPAGAAKAYQRLALRVAELVEAAGTRNFTLETAEDPRETDRDADHVHQMQRQWLGALAGLDAPENVLRSVAQRLYETWYGDGAFYAGSTYPDQWAQTETRLAAVAIQGLTQDYQTLGGAHFLAALQRVHAKYGQVTGITAEGPEAPEEVALKPLANAVRLAIREYIYKVGASVEPDEPATATLAARLLRPYTQWGSTPAGSKAQPIVTEQPAPADAETEDSPA